MQRTIYKCEGCAAVIETTPREYWSVSDDAPSVTQQ